MEGAASSVIEPGRPKWGVDMAYFNRRIERRANLKLQKSAINGKKEPSEKRIPSAKFAVFAGITGTIGGCK
jgi:hypothetical protein